MRYGSCYLSERRYVKHVPVTGARAARSPGHVRFNVGQKILRRSLVCAPDADCPFWYEVASADEVKTSHGKELLALHPRRRARATWRHA
jgi:hypothetical protein